MGKEGFALVGVGLSFASYLPYLWSVARGRTVPHAFSWVIWGVLSAIGSAVQLASGSGFGAWTTCSSACFCLLVAALATWKGGFQATRSDWITFACGMAAIPLWYVTGNPLWALLLLIAIEGTAFWLTIKKGWFLPREDMIFCYAVYALATSVALAAVQVYTFVTVSYLVFIVLANLAVVAVLAGRRWSSRLAVVGLVLVLLPAVSHACSPDQYRIVEFTPAIGHWQDEQGEETGQQQPTFSGHVASQCRGIGNLEIEITGRTAQGRQVQQAITTIRNVGPGGADFDYTSLLPYDARVAGYQVSIVRVQ